MFSQNNPSPFGSPPGQPTGFGGTAPAFGSPPAAPFGAQPTTTPFGGGTAFGSPPAPSGFGTTSTFGASAPSGFGTSTFGAQPSTSAFGGGGGFGSAAPSAFGTVAPAPSAGLFGASTSSTGGSLFGSGGGTSGFGTSTPSTFGGGLGGGTAFGSSTSAGFVASTTTQSTGLFGAQPAPAPAFGGTTFGAPGAGAFGTSTTGGLFGAAAPAPSGGGLFGAPTSTGGGTKVAPYQATTRQDGTTSIQLHAITAMQQYEGKSFEELRFEDYSQGNKGTGSGGGGGFVGFGTGSTGIFGSTTPAPAPFGAPTAGGFGSNTPSSGFGMSNSGTFSAPAPATFGAPASFGSAPSTGLFGATAPAPAFGGFASTAPKAGGLFASPTPAPVPGAGLFGSAPAPAPSIFGAPPAPAPGGLFGSAPPPVPGGLFGTAPTFGAPSPASTGGLFGTQAPAPSGSLFGAPAPGSGLFSAPTPAPPFGGSSLFGPAPGQSGGLFGAAKPTGGSLFGSSTPAGGGLFGASAPAPTPGLYGASASSAAPQPFFATAPVNIAAPLASEVLAQQMAAMENQRKELEKLDVWRGKSPDIASVVPTSLSESEASTILPYRGYARPYSASPKSQTKIRPRGFSALSVTKSPPQLSLTPHTNNNERVMMSPSMLVSSSVKRLVIKPESLTPKPKMRLHFQESPRDGVVTLNGLASADTLTCSSPSNLAASNLIHMQLPSEKGEESDRRRAATSPGYEYYQRIVAAPDEAGGGSTATRNKNLRLSSPPKHMPKLTKVGYCVSPSLDELSAMSEADLAAVPEFSVTHNGFGKVEWEGAVDIRDVDLDQVVSIERGDVAVYLIEEETGSKPPQGTKLNRPATITLWNVIPKDGDSTEKFVRKITRSTARMGAELISYDAETGEWIFRVHHFSRYGLYDSSDDDEELSGPDGFGVSDAEEGTRTPGDDTVVEMLTSDHLATYVSDVEMSESDYSVPFPMTKAERAYDALSQLIEESQVAVDDKGLSSQQFADEVERGEINVRTQHGVYPNDYNFPVSWSGFSSKIQAKANLKVATISTDASLRFGGSFGVCWHPNGSLLHLCPTMEGLGPVLVRSRPMFVTNGADQGSLKRMLETHLAHSLKRTQTICPLYVLPPGYANSGTDSSHRLLSRAVVEFAAGSKVKKQAHRRDDHEKGCVAYRAFLLLSCLLDTNDGDVAGRSVVGGSHVADFISKSNRLEAVVRWIIGACEYDVERCTQVASQRNDIPAAIFAAVTGGDLEKASSIASKNGYPHLASLLMAGPCCICDVSKQVSEWRKIGVSTKMAAPLLSVYALLGGEFEQVKSKEQEQLDWRRHFATRLLFGPKNSNLSQLVRTFSFDVNVASVPYPHPRYVNHDDHRSASPFNLAECTLYRMLQLFDNPSQCLLSHLVEPSGHTCCLHDYSLAFHLASSLSALGVCSPLEPMQEARLVDSFSAQLLDSGNWEWAVFVQLCSLTTASLDNPNLRLRKAKEMVVTNFCPTHPGASLVQSFLETRIGVPKQWFEEALALRCASRGDVLGYVLHAASFSMERSLQALERVYLPNLFFMSPGDIEASMKLLQTCDSYGSPLAKALIDFLQLSNDVRRISESSRSMIVEHMPCLIETAHAIEATLVSYQGKAKTLGPSSLGVYPAYRMVPMESFLAEALAGLALQKLQLRALEVNLPIPGVSQSTKQSPTEGFMVNMIDAYNSAFAEEKLLRGYIDGENKM